MRSGLSRIEIAMRPLRTLLVFAAVAILSVPADQSVAAVQDGGVRMVAVEGEGAKYWSRWRGPSGQGLATGTGYPTTWSATENLKWRVDVPGTGNSSPIVWGDRIYLTTAYNRGAKLSVIAFRRTDGARLWETFAPSHAGYAHFKNGHASATAATDGAYVYASFGSSLVAVDANGKLAWNQDIGPVSNYHGPAGSPLLYRDRLILFQDQNSGSFIAAFDTKTGRQLWRTPRDATVGWGTPVAVRVGDHDEIIVNGQSRVQAYDPATGRELWACRGTTLEVIPTPVVGYGLVYQSLIHKSEPTRQEAISYGGVSL
jgi:outer membrane protein assembly factor BamB